MAHNINNIFRVLALSAYCLAFATQHLSAQDSSSAEAKIALSFQEEDSVKQVKAVVTKANTPLKGVDVNFFIKKSFGLLPVGDGAVTTDDHGEAVADFPVGIPGDPSGNVTVTAKVEENDQTGELQASKDAQWGAPVEPSQHSIDQRTLYASAANAPIPLVVTVVSLVALVWGTIFYIVYQLVAIKKARAAV